MTKPRKHLTPAQRLAEIVRLLETFEALQHISKRSRFGRIYKLAKGQQK